MSKTFYVSLTGSGLFLNDGNFLKKGAEKFSFNYDSLHTPGVLELKGGTSMRLEGPEHLLFSLDKSGPGSNYYVGTCPLLLPGLERMKWEKVDDSGGVDTRVKIDAKKAEKLSPKETKLIAAVTDPEVLSEIMLFMRDHLRNADGLFQYLQDYEVLLYLTSGKIKYVYIFPKSLRTGDDVIRFLAREIRNDYITELGIKEVDFSSSENLAEYAPEYCFTVDGEYVKNRKGAKFSTHNIRMLIQKVFSSQIVM